MSIIPNRPRWSTLARTADPNMDAALRRHIAETRDRLDEALAAMSESPSALKEGGLGFIGNIGALGHAPAQDQILMNAFANRAFENDEAAAYDAPITLAEAAGQGARPPAFEMSLREQLAMAQKMADLVRRTTRRNLELTVGGDKADR